MVLQVLRQSQAYASQLLTVTAKYIFALDSILQGICAGGVPGSAS